MDYQVGIDPAYPRSAVVVARPEPQEYIDDIFAEQPDRWPMFAEWLHRISVRIRLWRLNRRFGR